MMTTILQQMKEKQVFASLDIHNNTGKNPPSTKAIQLALHDKYTSKVGISGGIGLAFLKEFIVMNKGCMQIISNDGFYQIEEYYEFSQQFKGEFPGTIVNMLFRTDNISTTQSYENFDEKDIF